MSTVLKKIGALLRSKRPGQTAMAKMKEMDPRSEMSQMSGEDHMVEVDPMAEMSQMSKEGNMMEMDSKTGMNKT